MKVEKYSDEFWDLFPSGSAWREAYESINSLEYASAISESYADSVIPKVTKFLSELNVKCEIDVTRLSVLLRILQPFADEQASYYSENRIKMLRYAFPVDAEDNRILFDVCKSRVEFYDAYRTAQCRLKRYYAKYPHLKPVIVELVEVENLGMAENISEQSQPKPEENIKEQPRSKPVKNISEQPHEPEAFRELCVNPDEADKIITALLNFNAKYNNNSGRLMEAVRYLLENGVIKPIKEGEQKKYEKVIGKLVGFAGTTLRKHGFYGNQPIKKHSKNPEYAKQVKADLELYFKEFIK